jgi:hypothetical protein
VDDCVTIDSEEVSGRRDRHLRDQSGRQELQSLPPTTNYARD